MIDATGMTTPTLLYLYLLDTRLRRATSEMLSRPHAGTDQRSPDRLEPRAHPSAICASSYSSRLKIRNERSQCSLLGFFRTGSMMVKTRARAPLRQPAVSGGRPPHSRLR